MGGKFNLKEKHISNFDKDPTFSLFLTRASLIGLSTFSLLKSCYWGIHKLLSNQSVFEILYLQSLGIEAGFNFKAFAPVGKIFVPNVENSRG